MKINQMSLFLFALVSVVVVSGYPGKLTFAIGAEGVQLQIDGSRK